MIRRIAAAGLLGLPILQLGSFAQKPSVSPNFIIFIADDVSWDDLGLQICS